MQGRISTIEEVDCFVRSNIFWVTQRKSRWIYPESSDPTDKFLFDRYIEYTFKTTAAWKKSLSKEKQKIFARDFDNAILNWLRKYYPTRVDFVYGEVVYYEDGLPEKTPDIIDPVKCNCTNDCVEDCENRVLEVECGFNCPSGENCKNMEAQKPFNWQNIISVEYINKDKGAGVFAKEDIPGGAYLGVVSGFALSFTKTRKVIAEGGGNYLFSGKDSNRSVISTINPHKYGNHTRFFNHSCSPNTQPCRWSSAGRWVIKFYAQKLIRKVR